MTRSRLRLRALCLAASLCSGCAGVGLLGPSPQGPGIAHTPAGQALSPQAAAALITVGKSTQPEVATALGPAIVVRFDSGDEVWVYRWPGADRSTGAATELVLLFEPPGVVAKLRVRQGAGPGHAGR
ncbi:hypothetical protein LRH25_31925 [Ideonella azotifigens]|nr:hypothetical protein [Ideonella azotifigens]MCD2344936.1 hypothetical protein [Ideonella azotifigens]